MMSKDYVIILFYYVMSLASVIATAWAWRLCWCDMLKSAISHVMECGNPTQINDSVLLLKELIFIFDFVSISIGPVSDQKQYG